MSGFRTFARNWFQASRPQFFVATLVPLALGMLLAGRGQRIHWGLAALTVASAFLVHLATNLANDLFDYLSGADSGDSIGGSRVIQEGIIAPRSIGRALFLLYGLAALGGLWILLATRTWWLAGYMLLAFCSSLFYTAPPIRYGYHGLGEFMVFINMGPLMVSGAYAVQTGTLAPDVLLLSLPTGIMVAMILYFQSLPDRETDSRSGKRTVASRLSRQGAHNGVRLFAAAAYLAIIALCAGGLLSPWSLLCLLTLPLVLKLDRMLATTADWQQVHGRGKVLRLFYIANGLCVMLGAWLARPA